MNVTAVILSSRSIRKEIPGVQTLVHVSKFQDAAGLLDQRIAAIRKVRTEWFFFLDDDDALPDNYLQVLERCTSVTTPLAYTNELVNGALWRSGSYSQEAHLRNPLLVHHLAVCRTEAALRACEVIPRGTFAVEPLLYSQIAKEGATWLDEVGYHWQRKSTGLSYHPTLTRGIVRAMLWMQGRIA
ncbi:hypothetical protein D3C71_79560 [compost metagenome]